MKAELAGDDPDRAKRFRTVWVGKRSDAVEALTVAEAKIEGGRVLLLFEGHADRTAAERLRGLSVFVEPGDAERPAKGRGYIHDVIGCEVRTKDGRVVGTIDDVYDAAGQHLWSIRGGDNELLVPAIPEFIVSVDTERKVVVIDPPQGLLD